MFSIKRSQIFRYFYINSIRPTTRIYSIRFITESVMTRHSVKRYEYVSSSVSSLAVGHREILLSTHTVFGTGTFNSSPPSGGYMRQWIGSTLVHIMACRRSHYTSNKYPKMHHFETRMCTHVLCRICEISLWWFYFDLIISQIRRAAVAQSCHDKWQ